MSLQRPAKLDVTCTPLHLWTHHPLLSSFPPCHSLFLTVFSFQNALPSGVFLANFLAFKSLLKYYLLSEACAVYPTWQYTIYQLPYGTPSLLIPLYSLLSPPYILYNLLIMVIFYCPYPCAIKTLYEQCLYLLLLLMYIKNLVWNLAMNIY